MVNGNAAIDNDCNGEASPDRMSRFTSLRNMSVLILMASYSFLSSSSGPPPSDGNIFIGLTPPT